MSEDQLTEPPSTKSETIYFTQSKLKEKILNANAEQFRQQYYPQTTISDWNDWKWQLKNRLCNNSDIDKIFNLSPNEKCENSLPIAITPYYASVALHSPAIRKTVVPTNNENLKSFGEAEDPLCEERQSPLSCLVHRYPDRVLFLTTNYCASYCRYCTRSRIIEKDKNYKRNIQAALDYIQNNNQIRDVLLSGGDFLTMATERIEWILESVSKIKHVEFIRLGTKIPVVLPQRITSPLLRVLKKYKPWISIHFTHSDELTPETQEACNKLADIGLPLGSQTVLLKDVNDNTDTMKDLFHNLLKVRVRPYYLYQCDPIFGSSHFRTSVEKGIEIIQNLRGYTTGYAIPSFVIDAPGGGGKIPIMPEYVIGKDKQGIILKNFEGKIFHYPDLL